MYRVSDKHTDIAAGVLMDSDARIDAGIVMPISHPETSVGEPVRGGASAWPALAAALLGFFVITLDALVVNVALPAIGDDLSGGMTGLQWVVDGYTLMFAALLLSAGALSDRVGARRAFGAGLALFVAA
jgi:MFS transporter, DHA2 family, methylenomycin A resistance protein